MKNFNKISKSLEEFKSILELPYDLIKNVLSSDELSVDNEKQVCDIVLNYIKTRRSITEISKFNDFNIDLVKKEEEKKEEKEDEKKAQNPSEIENPPEENKEIPFEEIKNEEIIEKKAEPIFSNEEINYNDSWNINLAKTKEKFTMKILKYEEERVLVECIRFSFLTHSDLLSLSLDPILQNHKDLVLIILLT